MKLIINDFQKLDTETQEGIQDFIAGHTSNFQILYDKECDICGQFDKDIVRLDTYGGVVRVCKKCLLEATKN